VQAMVLTAIVITLGLTAFVLAMAYRSWQLHGHDEVQDDLEDRRVARQAARNAPAFEDLDTEESGQTLDDEAAQVRDETDADGDGVTDRRLDDADSEVSVVRPGEAPGTGRRRRPDDGKGS
jgi:multicomponent Na+:H+ antiporter subunit C